MLVAVVATVVLLALGAWWAVRWAFESRTASGVIVGELAPRVPGLQVESPSGSFATGLSSSRFSWENEDFSIVVIEPRLEWTRDTALALVRHVMTAERGQAPVLRIESATATRVEVTRKPRSAAGRDAANAAASDGAKDGASGSTKDAAGGPREPLLPVVLDVRRLAVDEVVYVDGAARASAREVRGGAASGLDAAAVSWSDGDSKVDVTTAKVTWTEPAYHSLMRALASPPSGPPSLVLESVSIARMSVKPGSAPANKPRSLPETLDLPIIVDVPSISIGEIEVATAGPSVVLRTVAGALSSDGTTHRVRVARLVHASGNLAGELAIGARRPFALAGTLQARGKASEVGLAFRGRIDGTLQFPVLAGTLAVDRGKSGGTGEFAAELSPFAELPLRRLKASTRRLDLAAWNAEWPKTSLDVDADAEMRGERELAGRVDVVNAAAGPIDASRIPLASLTGSFVASTDRFALSGARARTTNGSEVRGDARFADDVGEFRLVTDGLDPSEIDRRAKALRVAGTADLRISGDAVHVVADLRHRGYLLVGEATKRGSRIDVAEARIASPHGNARVAGHADLDGPRPFEASGELSGFNPADFGAFPEARLSGRFTAAGKLEPSPVADVRLELAESTLRGQPLRGSVAASVSEQRRFVGEFDLDYAGNRAEGKGAFGAVGDRLTWRIDAPAIGRLDERAGGALQASGVLSGTLDAPTVEFAADGRALRFATATGASGTGRGKAAPRSPPVSAERGDATAASAGRLHAEGRVEIRAGGVFSVRAEAADVVVDGRTVQSARLDGSGRLEQHVLAAEATVEGRAVAVQGRGGWQRPDRWTGTIEKFVSERPAIALQAPVELRVAGSAVALGPTVITAEGARVELARAAWTDGSLQVAGSFRDVPLSRILAAADSEWRLPSDLRLMGRVDAEVGRDVRGTIEVVRQSGDVALSEVPTITAGLSDLRVSVAASGGGAVTLNAIARGERIGSVDADLASRLVRRNGGWSVTGSVPLRGTVNAEVRDLVWLNTLLPGDWTLAGRGEVRAVVAGTLDAPRLDGTITGERLAVRSPETGIDLSSGVLAGRFDGAQFVLDRFEAKGPSGSLTGKGTITGVGGQAKGRVDLRAEKLRVVSRPDRSVIVTGDAAVTVEGSQVKVSGRLRADEARIDLPPAEKPTLGADVVVVRAGPQAAKPPRATSASPLAGLDVEFDLGDQFYLRGRGLDTRLVGTLRFTQANGTIGATGTVRTVDGTYLAYGRKLEIERGIITFAGAMDNPRLDIRALRTRQDVEAGVQVTGTLSLPQVQLFSRPDVPDTEKLSWLVLGHGLDKSNRAQAGMLQSAALALLTPAAGANLQTKIAEVFGFDQISFSTGGNELQKGIVTVGKQLTRDLYVSVEQGIAQAESFVRVNFLFTKRWQLAVRSGGGENAVDVFYTLKFD